MKATKLIPCLLAMAALPALASGTTAVPKRVGPVSYYGALHTSGGKIIGAKNNQEAMLRGMSLFWSDATGLPYYNKNVISWAAENLGMDVFRFAMGITYYDSDGGTSNALDKNYSYAGAPDQYIGVIDRMVEAAVENDIYIILDWHSHRAEAEQAIAKEFFKSMAEKYKNVPNVIYEIFNEPVHQGWSTVQGYANAVIPGIRANTENLVLVGTPSWSQMTQYGGVSGTNVGYVLHFYAGSHSVGQYGGRATQAKGAGNAVFITEWGTVNADGAGSASTGSTNEWTSFMDQNNISNCNWSLRQVESSYNDKSETSAMFEGSKELTSKSALSGATYTASGSLVKAYLTKNKRDWADMLVKAKNTGTCAFKAVNAKETDGQVTGKANSSCTYTSSNEKVATISAGIITINGAGFAIFTGNDGSKSIVQVAEIPRQTVPNFFDLNCNYGATCTSNGSSANRTLAYSGGTNKEWIVTTEAVTLEGAKFTLTSLDPSIVTIKEATCTATECSSLQKGKKVLMYEFKKYGSAKVVATAPAVSGYLAVNDTATITYSKAPGKARVKFVNTKVALGGTAKDLLYDATIYNAPITYTFNGKDSPSPYATKDGNNLVAGSQNAVFLINADIPETDNYTAYKGSVTVIIGDSALAANKEDYYKERDKELVNVVKTNPKLPLHATISNAQLSIAARDAEDINVGVFSVTGQKVLEKKLSSNNASMSLAQVPNGSYLVVITQGIKQLNVRWNKTK